jgi:hypothetical protein
MNFLDFLFQKISCKTKLFFLRLNLKAEKNSRGGLQTVLYKPTLCQTKQKKEVIKNERK